MANGYDLIFGAMQGVPAGTNSFNAGMMNWNQVSGGTPQGIPSDWIQTLGGTPPICASCPKEWLILHVKRTTQFRAADEGGWVVKHLENEKKTGLWIPKDEWYATKGDFFIYKLLVSSDVVERALQGTVEKSFDPAESHEPPWQCTVYERGNGTAKELPTMIDATRDRHYHYLTGRNTKRHSTVHYSENTGRPLPAIGVYDREGIDIHCGINFSWSTGCFLLTSGDDSYKVKTAAAEAHAVAAFAHAAVDPNPFAHAAIDSNPNAAALNAGDPVVFDPLNPFAFNTNTAVAFDSPPAFDNVLLDPHAADAAADTADAQVKRNEVPAGSETNMEPRWEKAVQGDSKSRGLVIEVLDKIGDFLKVEKTPKGSKKGGKASSNDAKSEPKPRPNLPVGSKWDRVLFIVENPGNNGWTILRVSPDKYKNPYPLPPKTKKPGNAPASQ